MTAYSTLFSWLFIVGKPASQAANEPTWVILLAYVAALVFVIILLAAVYLIVSAVRQRHSQDGG